METENPIKVKLIAHTDVSPLQLASHAALECYQAETPEWGKIIDVEQRLFAVGHHTTLQHFFLTFNIENIAVGDVTFGLHLASPFYNSDQRSGRFCAKMFLDPDFHAIENYIRCFWPSIDEETFGYVMNYIRCAVVLFHGNIKQAEQIAEKFIREDRPRAGDKYISMNASKIAQEQLRMFIPVIFPTGLDFTVNLSALVALWESAWTVPMRYATDKMKEELLRVFPELGFMFNENRRRQGEWSLAVEKADSVSVKFAPEISILGMSNEHFFIEPSGEDTHPVDKLHFQPETMDNSIGEIRTKVTISIATMGQDQRHRTIKRSKPEFTGGFYLPPIAREMKLENAAADLMKLWMEVSKKIPGILAMILAPYGAMVTYEKSSSFNAIIYEQGKRLCWCAQEEISNLGMQMRSALKGELEKNISNAASPASAQLWRMKMDKLLRIFEPPCYRTGKCVEGLRYCGRDIGLRNGGDYFPTRRV